MVASSDDKEIAHCEARLAQTPLDSDVLQRMALAKFRQHRANESAALLQRALDIKPSARLHYYLGGALNALGRPAEALAQFDAALALEPNNPPTQLNRAQTLLALNRPDDALPAAEFVLRFVPDYAAAWVCKGEALASLKRPNEADESFRRAVMIAPQLLWDWTETISQWIVAERFAEGLALCDRVLKLAPNNVRALNQRGELLSLFGRDSESEAVYSHALSIDRLNPETWFGLGNALTSMARFGDALPAYAEALRLKPDYVQALEAHGNCLADLERYEESTADFERLLRLDPDHKWAAGRLLSLRRRLGDWVDDDKLLALVADGVISGSRRLWPFESLLIFDDPSLQIASVRSQIDDMRPKQVPYWPPRSTTNSKLRVGYLSGDFHNHATVHLMGGVFEAHDKSHFEIVGFGCGPNVADSGRSRVRAAMDEFVVIPPLPFHDYHVATLVHERNIDILVDLSGFTRHGRPMALITRPAPIQVNYLGYPGSLGGEFIDYLIADRVIIPSELAQFYDEKIVRLPHSYQPNSQRCVSPRIPERAQVGLPQDGVVFCCFNNAFKLNPTTFASWMRILRACPGSVLWLLVSPKVSEKLKLEATAAGVRSDRLVFADYEPIEQHLARLALADIVLDCWPYGAHTTASDALYMGVPVVTWAGQTFASRVAASLVTFAGVPELSALSLESYEELAIELAQNPALLDAVKSKLKAARTHAPLFDVARTTRAIEYAYVRMYERYREGQLPIGFDVPDMS